MISWGAKDPIEVRTYRYSWLGQLNGAGIDNAALVQTYGRATLSDEGFAETGIYVTLSGGIEGEEIVLVSTIVTTTGQTLQETIMLDIEPTCHMGPSTSNKRDLVSMAYEEVALSGYEFDVTPEELFSGLRSMDSAMAMDKAQSINLNYNAPAKFGQGDLEDYSGIPDAAIEYASLRLAKAICSKMGKTLSQDARGRLVAATAAIRAMTAKPATARYHYGTVRGAGNRNWGYWGAPFLRNPRHPIRYPTGAIPVAPIPAPTGAYLNFQQPSNSQYLALFAGLGALAGA